MIHVFDFDDGHRVSSDEEPGGEAPLLAVCGPGLRTAGGRLLGYASVYILLIKFAYALLIV